MGRNDTTDAMVYTYCEKYWGKKVSAFLENSPEQLFNFNRQHTY